MRRLLLLVVTMVTVLVARKRKVEIGQGADRSEFNTLWSKMTDRSNGKLPRLGMGPAGRMKNFEKLFNDQTKDNRFKLFTAAQTRINSLKSERTYILGDNFFALMSDAERGTYLGVKLDETMILEKASSGVLQAGNKEGRAPPPPPHRLLSDGRSKRSTNKTLDWRELGVVTPVKNQGSCGSCWSFGAVAVIEGAYKLETGTLKTFSEQQILDCNKSYGCNGGWWPKVWEDVKTNDYISLGEEYGYLGAKSSDNCARTTSNGIPDATLTSYTVMRDSDAEDTMIANLEAYGPIAICLYVDDMMYFYRSGVIDACLGENCNHLVTLIGYDEDTLIIKNSWGTDWGLDGYFRVKRGCGTQGYSYWASYATMKKAVDESETGTDAPDTYNIVMELSSIVKMKDYPLESGTQAGDIFAIIADGLSTTSKKWFVNLMIGNDFAYHLEFHSKKSIYRINARSGGTWRSRVEYAYPASFNTTGPCKLYLRITKTGFGIMMNKVVLNNFSHKAGLPYSSINEIEMGGAGATFNSFTQYRVDSTSASGSGVPSESSTDKTAEKYTKVFEQQTGRRKRKEYSLEEGVEIGDIFTILGSGKRTKKWTVYLNSKADVVFMININWTNSSYTMNSKEKRKWSVCQVSGQLASSVADDDELELDIRITEQGFEATINNEDLLVFPHKQNKKCQSVSDSGKLPYQSIAGIKLGSFDSGVQFRLDADTADSSSEAEEEEESSEKDCVQPGMDYSQHCSYWNGLEYCTNPEYSEWMSNYCPRTCSVCTRARKLNSFTNPF